MFVNALAVCDVDAGISADSVDVVVETLQEGLGLGLQRGTVQGVAISSRRGLVATSEEGSDFLLQAAKVPDPFADRAV